MTDVTIGSDWIILIVDDNNDNIVVARTVLEYYGATVHIAINGQEGLTLLDTIDPTIILLDLSMPVMNGWEMLKQLRKLDKLAAVPIIAVTAHAMDGDRSRVMDAGFDDYIPKPYDVHVLIKRIQTAVKRKNEERGSA